MITAEQLQQRKKIVLELCICPGCPSWVECGEEGGFCHPTIGKSGCIQEESGCSYPSCPVTEKMKLNHDYYCTRGSEKEQSGT
ncbi:MAG: hypothetical protein CEE40_03885 [Chloroflexi bacterium B3_Chlor]|nr:MAG: hypothetical protein CEE40_03885 [Chloroflexi bacterium B3_Chlor]